MFVLGLSLKLKNCIWVAYFYDFYASPKIYAGRIQIRSGLLKYLQEIMAWQRGEFIQYFPYFLN